MANEINSINQMIGQFGDYSRVVFTDEWMGDSTITVTYEGNEPKAPTAPSGITCGGELFTQRTPATVTHQNGSAVNSYQVTIKYYSVRDELTRARFLDVVPEQNGAYYSALPSFSFYVTDVSQLLERIAANMVRAGFSGWTFTGSGIGTDDTGEPLGGQVVSVGNISCWEALALVQSQFNLNFFVRGRSVTVGTDAVEPAVISSLHYGKDNGLYKEEEGYDDSQYLVTKLYAFGNTTNMPNHYYMYMNLRFKIEAGTFESGLSGYTFGEIPHFDMEMPPAPTHEKMGDDDPDYVALETYNAAKKEYEDACKAIEDATGISGDEDLKNLESVIELAGTSTCWVLSETFKPGHFTNYHPLEKYALFKTGSKDSKVGTKAYLLYCESNGRCIVFGGAPGYILAGMKKAVWPVTEGDEIPNFMNCNRLMLPNFGTKDGDNFIYDVYVGGDGTLVANGSTWTSGTSNVGSNMHEEAVVFDGSNGLPDIYPSLKYLRGENGQELDLVTGASYDEIGTGVVADGTTINSFSIYIPNIGFDISDYVAETPSISMQTGGCAGRSFEILDVKERSAGGYELICKRASDNEIYYPNSYFGIKVGDKYVLTGIEMPDEYIVAASKELYRQAKLYLEKNNHYVKKWSMDVDSIFMARHGSPMLYAGQSMNDSIIDHVTITWEPNSLPKYDISLSDEKTVSMLQRKLNSSSTISGTGNSDEFYNGSTYGYLDSSLYGTAQGGQYLSRVKADSARGMITFKAGATLEGQTIVGKNGIKSKNYSAETGVGIYEENGLWYINTDFLNVRYKMTAKELEIQKVSHIGGQLMLSAAYGTIDHVSEDSSYYYIYFKATDEDGNVVDNLWYQGDIVYCQTFDLKKDAVTGLFSNRMYKYTVASVLSDSDTKYETGFNAVKVYKSGTRGPLAQSSVPAEGDAVVQCGNRDGVSNRTSVMILAGAGTSSPYIYMFRNVKTYELKDPFIKLDDNPSLTVNSLTVGATDIGEAVGDSFDIYQLDVNAPLNSDWSECDDDIERYQSPVIGLTGWPDKEEGWLALDSYMSHSQPGDVAITKDGIYYRFTLDDYDSTYGWVIISDKYLIQANKKAEETMKEIDDMSSDAVISALEKKSLSVTWKEIKTNERELEKIATRFSGDSTVNSAWWDYSKIFLVVNSWMVDILGLESEEVIKQNTFIGTTYLQFDFPKKYDLNSFVTGEFYGFLDTMKFYYEALCNLNKEITIGSIDMLGRITVPTSEEIAAELNATINSMMEAFNSLNEQVATFLELTDTVASLTAWATGESGTIYGSGFLTESNFAGLFSQYYNEWGQELVSANIYTYLFDGDVQYDEETGNVISSGVIKSGIKLKADQIDFEGGVTFNANLEDFLGLGWIKQMYGDLDPDDDGNIPTSIPDDPEGLRQEIWNYLHPEEGTLPVVGDILGEFLKKRVLNNVCGSDLDRLARLVGDDNLYKYISGQTTIQGGYIKTGLIDVGTILGENAVFSGKLEAATGEFTGKVTANEGEFHGDIYADHGYFKGIIFEKPNVVDEDNFEDNFVKVTEIEDEEGRLCSYDYDFVMNGMMLHLKGDLSSYDYYEKLMDDGVLEDCGIFVRLPISNNGILSKYDKFTAIQLIGKTLIIINESNTTIGVHGSDGGYPVVPGYCISMRLERNESTTLWWKVIYRGKVSDFDIIGIEGL